MKNDDVTGTATQSPSFVFAKDNPAITVADGVERQVLGFGPDILMMRVTFKKGSVGYLHKHPHRQVSYIESGSFEVTVGGEKKIQKAGDCYYVPAEIEHGVVALEVASLIDVFTPCRADILASLTPTKN